MTITKEDVEKLYAELDKTYEAFIAENPAPEGKRWMINGAGKLGLFHDQCSCDDDSCSG